MHQTYLLGFFDVLGFKARLAKAGLDAILQEYESLIEVIDARTKHVQLLFGDMNFQESAYLTAEGEPFIFHKVLGAYGSDSLIVWAKRAYPEARDKTELERIELAKDSETGWQYYPIPCDHFVETCNELICRSLEIGLPLRGALSMGIAVLDQDRRIFLGSPLIEATQLEKGQRIIGVSLCKSFVNQIVPKRFLVPFDAHLKEGVQDSFGGYVLDWPRHWRRTRNTNPRQFVERLNQDTKAALYYENTLRFINVSDEYMNKFESSDEVDISKVYKQYKGDIKLSVRFFRN